MTNKSTSYWYCSVCAKKVSRESAHHNLRVRRTDNSGWDHQRCKLSVDSPASDASLCNADSVIRGRELAESGRFPATVPPSWTDDNPSISSEEFVVDRDEPEHQDQPTTWEPLDLGPYLRGEIQRPEPTLGACRSDGQRFLYPGREHAVLGETEAGKTWLALACVAAELTAGQRVLYLHYEEPDATSTVERLRLLGVPPDTITRLLQFVAPTRPVRTEWLAALLDPAPVLVIHDGVNEAMSLHGADIMSADGASTFRRRLIVPCLKAGAATLACDHVPHAKNDGRGRDSAYGSVHKGNAIDGARFVMEKCKPFGRGLRGVSNVFVTKDRPGRLRALGKPSQIPGKTLFGTLAVDDTPTAGADFLSFYAPRTDDSAPASDPAADVAEIVHTVISGLPDATVRSSRALFAHVRQSGHQIRDAKVRDAVDDLLVSGRLTEVRGKNNSLGYRVPSASR